MIRFDSEIYAYDLFDSDIDSEEVCTIKIPFMLNGRKYILQPFTGYDDVQSGLKYCRTGRKLA